MAKVRFNVKNEIAKALEEEGKQIVKLTERDLDALSKRALEIAEKEREKAEYDGDPDDAIVYWDVSKSGKTWTITLSGPAAMAIEYGATSNGKHDYWFFSGRGKDIRLNAGGAHAHYERVIRREGYTDRWMGRGANGFGRQEYSKFVPYETPSRHKDENGKWRLNDPIRIRGGEKDRINNDPAKPFKTVSGGVNEYKVHRYVHDPKMKKWVDKNGRERGSGYATTLAEKPDSYITKGNEPNHIMDKTFKYLAQGVDAIAKK